MSRFAVPQDSDGARADVALAAVAGIPRARARRWIDDGRVRLDGSPCRASQRVRGGGLFEATPPDEVAPSQTLPEAIPLTVLFEDAELIVIDKPAGLVVHPAPGHATGTLVHALLHHCTDLAGIGGVLRPGIVHRLDRGTSGVLVVAKNDVAHAALSTQFRDHSIERVYRAWVRAMPGADSGRMDRAIGRHPTDRKRMSVRTVRGREAHTAWRMLQRFARSGVSELEIRPETGRTHQIRVHLASSGMPIVGDPIYGKSADAFGLTWPALHAAVLGFVHPRSGMRLRFESALPPELLALVERLVAREVPA